MYLSRKNICLVDVVIAEFPPAVLYGRRKSLRKAGSSLKLIHQRGEPAGVFREYGSEREKRGIGVSLSITIDKRGYC